MNDQADVRERVAAEMERFRKALPDLIEEHPNKWVVFLNGEVRGLFDDQLEAYRSAVEQFGRYGGFVVARAVEERLIPLTAALMFAPRCPHTCATAAKPNRIDRAEPTGCRDPDAS